MPDPSIHDFVDYRRYLRAWMDARPNRSLQFFAKRVGRSRSMVSMVCSATRSIPPQDVLRWADALGLEDDARTYWADLVAAEEAHTDAARQAARYRIRAARTFRSARPASDTDLFGAWYTPAIIELARCGGFRADPGWIAATLRPRVPVDEAAAALERLTALGVLRFDGDAVVVDEEPLATAVRVDDDALTLALRRYHQSLLGHAMEAIDTVPHEQRHVATLTLALRRDALPELIARLHRLQLEAVEPFRATSDGERVVHVALQVFPASDTTT